MSWFFFPALSIYVIILLHPLQETLKSTYKEMYVNTKWYLNCSIFIFYSEIKRTYCILIAFSLLLLQRSLTDVQAIAPFYKSSIYFFV